MTGIAGMSNKFNLKVLAADKTFYEGEAVSIIVPASDGSLQIMANHENMVLATQEGILQLKIDDDTNWKRAVVSIGFVKVMSNTVTVLVDSAEWPEDIDRVRAEKAMERAKEQLRQDQSIQEYKISRASLARAMMRLSESGRGPSE